MNDLSDVIEDCAVTIDIVRSLPPDMIKGRVQSAPQERKIRIRASVQPMPTRELMILPEGMRNQGAVKVFTKEPLFTVDLSDARIPDRFDYRGATYEVSQADDWTDVAGYYRVIAIRVSR